MSDELRHHVAPAPGEIVDRLDPPLRRLEVVDVERVVRAEALREGEPLGDPVEHDDVDRPRLPGHRRCIEAEPPRALDDDRLAGPEPRLVQAVDDLGEGAVERRDLAVGEMVGGLQHVVAGPKVVVVGVGPREVRGLIALPPPRPDPPGSAVELVVGETRGAAAAWIEVGVHDAVALAEGLSGRVGRDARAEALDPPRHFVPHDRRRFARGVAVPPVQVRTADVAEREAHQGRPGRDLGNRKLPELERLAGAGVDECSTLRHVLSLSRANPVTRPAAPQPRRGGRSQPVARPPGRRTPG